MRLNAYLARSGLASRRGADELIKKGLVSVNGQTASLNTQVSDADKVEVGGKAVKLPGLRYVLLNKPVGTITSLSDPEGRPKVTDLVDTPERLVPVGRLDFYTSGILILTNDGALAQRLMHPSFKVDKTYRVTTRGEITASQLKRMEQGMRLEDGMTAPARVKRLSPNTIEISIHEGRNRQIRRMIKILGLELKSLERVSYSILNLGGLKPGEWRDLSAAEVTSLKEA
jgi:pseudouridine synthase